MSDRPNAKELLEIARAVLTNEILPLLAGDKRITGLMVASALGMAARELAATLPPLPAVNVADLRAGKHDGNVALYERLLAEVKARALISNPRYVQGD